MFESFLTAPASVRSLVAVLDQVLSKGTFFDESLAAVAALVRRRLTVAFQDVRFEILLRFVLYLALLAWEWIAIAVDLHVELQIGDVHVALAADVAKNRLGRLVNVTLVATQVRHLREFLLTLIAREGFFITAMGSRVQKQVSLGRKALIAVLAREGFLSRVRSYMDFQFALR